MTEFHLTITGQRFYNGQLPALIAALQAVGSKQSACNLIAAGIHARPESNRTGYMGATLPAPTPDDVAQQAIETYDAIAEKLKCS